MRRCNHPVPANGGRDCKGETVKADTCGECPCELWLAYFVNAPHAERLCTVLSIIQVMLAGPLGLLLFVVVHVGRRALLWPPGNARVPHSAVLEREPEQKTAPVLHVTRGSSCQVTIYEQSYNNHIVVSSTRKLCIGLDYQLFQ